MTDWTEKAGAGCQVETQDKDGQFAKSYLLNSAVATCNSPLATGLLKIGFNRITLVLQKDSRGALTGAALFLSAPEDSLQLMAPLAQQLTSVPESDFLAKAFNENHRRGGMSIGESSFETKMDNSQGSQDLNNSITLNIKKGWGDCMAGCIYKHYWTIVGTPKKTTDHYDFDIQITESGSPIPDGGFGF